MSAAAMERQAGGHGPPYSPAEASVKGRAMPYVVPPLRAGTPNLGVGIQFLKSHTLTHPLHNARVLAAK